MAAALGLRVHTGWATAILLGGPPGGPKVLARYRLELADPAVPGSKAPFHAGLDLPKHEADAVVAPLCEAAGASTRRALAAWLAELRPDAPEIRGVGLVVSSRGDPARIANPHVRAHAAEGALYWHALEGAAEACALSHETLLEKEALEQVAAALGRPPDNLKRSLGELGRPLGPPWRAEEKAALLGAWRALA